MNLVRTMGMWVMTVMVLGALASPVLAQAKDVVTGQPAYTAPFSGGAMGAGLGAGMVIIGAALGFGRIGSAALESMARQPETAGRVQTAMIIIGALLEGVAFFALVICFLVGQKP